MKYTPEERLEIGRRIYEGEINVYKAAVEYGIGETCARNYMRRYRSVNGLPAKGRGTPIIREKGEGVPKPVVTDQPVLFDCICESCQPISEVLIRLFRVFRNFCFMIFVTFVLCFSFW